MKVDYLSEFGFRLSDYGKYSTIVLLLPPSPPPASRRSPRSVRPLMPVPLRRAVRSEALSAPAAPPRLCRSAAAGPALRAAQSLRTRGRRRTETFVGGCAVQSCGPGGAGRGGGPRCGAVRRGACRLFHFASFTCFTEVAPAPAAASAPLSRPRRGEPGGSAPSVDPSRQRGPRGPGQRGEEWAGRERMRRGSLWGF